MKNRERTDAMNDGDQQRRVLQLDKKSMEVMAARNEE